MHHADTIANGTNAIGSVSARRDVRRAPFNTWLAALRRAWRAEPARGTNAVRLGDCDAALLRDMGFEPRRHRPWAATERDFLPLQP